MSERFWRVVTGLNIRMAAFAGVIVLTVVTVWYGARWISDPNPTPDPIRTDISRAPSEAPPPAHPERMLELPERPTHNPFGSPYLNEVLNQRAREKLIAEQAEKTLVPEPIVENTAPVATDVKPPPAPPPPVEKITLTYRGMMIMTDRTRVALVEKLNDPPVRHIRLGDTLGGRVVKDIFRLEIVLENRNEEPIRLPAGTPVELEEVSDDR